MKELSKDIKISLEILNDRKNCKMMSEPGDICPHSLEGILSFLGKSWNLMIIGTLGNHKMLRFNALFDKLDGISPKTLTSRLKELEKIHLVSREAFAQIPPRVEYRLTKRGKELFSHLLPLMRWAVSIDHSE